MGGIRLGPDAVGEGAQLARRRDRNGGADMGEDTRLDSSQRVAGPVLEAARSGNHDPAGVQPLACRPYQFVGMSSLLGVNAKRIGQLDFISLLKISKTEVSLGPKLVLEKCLAAPMRLTARRSKRSGW